MWIEALEGSPRWLKCLFGRSSQVCDLGYCTAMSRSWLLDMEKGEIPTRGAYLWTTCRWPGILFNESSVLRLSYYRTYDTYLWHAYDHIYLHRYVSIKQDYCILLKASTKTSASCLLAREMNCSLILHSRNLKTIVALVAFLAKALILAAKMYASGIQCILVDSRNLVKSLFPL